VYGRPKLLPRPAQVGVHSRDSLKYLVGAFRRASCRAFPWRPYFDGGQCRNWQYPQVGDHFVTGSHGTDRWNTCCCPL
jgi:hypothetical protein